MKYVHDEKMKTEMVISTVRIVICFGTPVCCTDTERNGDETGIDCGGSCDAVCVPLATCGDTIIDPEETCDDGNTHL